MIERLNSADHSSRKPQVRQETNSSRNEINRLTDEKKTGHIWPPPILSSSQRGGIAMALTQENILKFLLDHGGQAKNSDLLNTFKLHLNCSDPAEKKQKRELFKEFVNNVAVVKEIEDVKYVFIKKKYGHLISGNPASSAQHSEQKKTSENTATLFVPGYDTKDRERVLHEKGKSSKLHTEQEPATSYTSDCVSINSRNTSSGFAVQKQSRVADLNPLNAQTVKVDRLPKYTQEEASKAEHCSPSDEVKIGKTGSKSALVAVKSGFETQNSQFHVNKDELKPIFPKEEMQKATQKPCALPLRLPPVEIKVEFVDSLPKDSDLSKGTIKQDIERSPRTKRRQFESIAASSSPQFRRAFKTTKPGEELKYPETVPLEAAEHEWLVRSAAGHWRQVYGLLLQDTLLTKKRDFMSGFTALHWAAKSGNNEMVCKLIEIAKRGGTQLDVNTKSYGGYTPLHIAAIHNHKSVMTLLVQDYAANVHVRDNSGKKAYHYLPVEAPPDLKQLLGEPLVMHHDIFKEKLEDDSFPELHKGFNTLSRLFQPHGGHRRKHKSLTGLYSLTEDLEEENAIKLTRPLSEMFL
ncbi:ankyrin repeat domain-containing protein SOWAHA [Arapaima gigas]